MNEVLSISGLVWRPQLSWHACRRWQAGDTLDAILDLRRRVGGDATVNLTSLDRASHVTHLCWRDEDGRLLATARLLMPDSEAEWFDLDYELDLTGRLPDRCAVAELSEVHIDPVLCDERAFREVFMAACAATSDGGRHWLLCATSSRYGHFLYDVGWAPLRHGARSVDEACVAARAYLGNVTAALCAESPVRLGTWAGVFAPVAAHRMRGRRLVLVKSLGWFLGAVVCASRWLRLR